MRPNTRTHLIALALGCASALAAAQSPGERPARPMMDPAHRQEMMAQRQADLKARLQLTAAQEGAWAQWIAAMQPPADRMGAGHQDRRRMHEEMAALSTPERIDRMNAMKAERDARQASRAQATKAFYATLSPEQQKVFDESLRHRGPHGHRGHADKRPQQG